jgi:phosphatidylserine decarboxylase
MVRDGYYYGFALFVIAAIVRFFTIGDRISLWLVAIPVLLALFFLWFFRDPERTIPQGPGMVVSPADGKVTEIASVMTPTGLQTRISIFLSVFNVHVNRSPIEGILSEVTYKKGEYLNALNPASAERNEQNLVIVEGEHATVAFKQIAGLLARRIVFHYKPGDHVERGQRVGLIKFGSRVDVMLPPEARIRVKLGEVVQGGAGILAEIAVDPLLKVSSIDTQVVESHVMDSHVREKMEKRV